jgi:hypothetical protein
LANVITIIGNHPKKPEVFSLMSRVFGKGSLETRLSSKEIREICEETLAGLPLDNKKVLVLIPDHTRHAPVDLFFRAITETLYEKVNLQYRDIRANEIDRWREDPDTLVVEEAGQVLYRLKNRP